MAETWEPIKYVKWYHGVRIDNFAWILLILSRDSLVEVYVTCICSWLWLSSLIGTRWLIGLLLFSLVFCQTESQMSMHLFLAIGAKSLPCTCYCAMLFTCEHFHICSWPPLVYACICFHRRENQSNNQPPYVTLTVLPFPSSRMNVCDEF